MEDTVIFIIVEELGSTATQGFMLLGMCVRRGYFKKIEEFFWVLSGPIQTLGKIKTTSSSSSQVIGYQAVLPHKKFLSVPTENVTI